MKKAILATKVGMTQIFNEDGVLTPVTVLPGWSLAVTQVKTEDNDGYKVVQVGFVDKREKLINKPMKGHFDKAGVSYKRYVREFKFENAEEYAVAQEIKADIFTAGDKIDATAISKGKGFRAQSRKRTAQRSDGSWFQISSSSGFQRRLLRSVQSFQRKRNAGSHGSQTDHCSEPGDRKS